MPKKQKPNEKTKFKRFLDKNNITIERLATATEMPFSSTYQIVMGYHENPSMKVIRKLIYSLQCKFEEIF